MQVKNYNPTTGKLLREYPEMTDEQVTQLTRQAHQAWLEWQHTDYTTRRGLMEKASDILRRRADEFAHLMATEMGKPIAQGRAEMEKCSWVCDWYAHHAGTMLDREMVETDATRSYVTFSPMGVILAVMPWNFPFWQVMRFAAPALMAGNAALLKHAANVPGCAEAIESVFLEAQFPTHLFTSLLISSQKVNRVLEDPLVQAATLTGSSRAGMAVASKAGQLLKKTVLELGGSDAYIVLEDADLEEAVKTCVASRLINAGQSCIAAKRFIVVRSVRKTFEEMFVEETRRYKMGNPLEEDTRVGPLARLDLRDDLHRQVTESIGSGASCLLGGEVPQGPGAFYPPTVLTNVGPGMPAYEEELFGPVAAIISVADEDEAVRVANDSRYGLGAAVFTQDVARGEEIASRKLTAGFCVVNDFVRSDPRLPFGGVKESGYGRELSHYGLKEFVNIKTVYVK